MTSFYGPIFFQIFLHQLTSFTLIFTADPDDLADVYNLDFLEDFDLEKLPDVEDWGEKMLGKIQAAMREMYGDDMLAAMPEDRIQPCLMGVSTLY